jgi:hypothetical protein
MTLPSFGFWRSVLIFVTTVIGISLWLPWYWPTVAVRATSNSVEPSAGMPLSFSIEDTGILKAHTPMYRCYFAHVHSAQPWVTIDDSSTAQGPVAAMLLSNDPVEISCPAFGVPAIEADVAILVSFRPSFDWRRSSGCGRYVLLTNSGKLAWFRKSSAPCKELAACLDRREAVKLKYLDTMRQFLKQTPAGQSSAQPTMPKLGSCLPKE